MHSILAFYFTFFESKKCDLLKFISSISTYAAIMSNLPIIVQALHYHSQVDRNFRSLHSSKLNFNHLHKNKGTILQISNDRSRSQRSFISNITEPCKGIDNELIQHFSSLRPRIWYMKITRIIKFQKKKHVLVTDKR